MEINKNDDKKPPGLSFGFSKRQTVKQLGTSAVAENLEKPDNSKDFVLSVEKNGVKSTKPTTKKNTEYVIPLIKQNKWRVNTSDVLESNNTNDLDLVAAKEILQDSALLNGDWEKRGQVDASTSIPLLMQNKVPDGFETDSKLNVNLRPEVPKDADYDEIPIEHFGMALLRGMGWKEGVGVGKNAKMIVPIEAQIRPKGLGLGAERTNDSRNDKASVNSRKLDEAEGNLELKSGAYCIVLSGLNRDLYGTVEGIDEDNARVMVKLSLSGKVVNLMQCAIQLVTKKNFEKHSKCLNKSKVDKYKDDELKKSSRREYEHNGKDYHELEDNVDFHGHSKKRHKNHSGNVEEGFEDDQYNDKREYKRHKHSKHSSKDEYEGKDKKHKHKHKHHKSKSKSSHRSSNSESEEMISVSEIQRPWLRKDLRVRIIDKDLKRGKYFKEKVVVEDVPTPGYCVCKTSDGKVIENVLQSSLETVVPRLDDAVVIIINGSYRGQLGRIMKRDKDKCLALVQLLSDRDIVLKLKYDEICEYVGDVQFVD